MDVKFNTQAISNELYIALHIFNVDLECPLKES